LSVRHCALGIVATTAFLIEGRDEDTLPERMLGLHKNLKVEISKVCVEYDYEPSEEELAKKKSGWFGGMFSSSRRGANKKDAKKNEAKNESLVKKAESIENVEPSNQNTAVPAS